MKKRSLLILLDKPQTFESLGRKSVLRAEDCLREITALIHEGFVVSGDELVTNTSAPGSLRSTTVPTGNLQLHLDDEVILSEAKFLLTDFCVDSFGTQSQAFVDDIRTCKSVKDLEFRLNAILAATENICPNQLPTLLKAVKEINATA